MQRMRMMRVLLNSLGRHTECAACHGALVNEQLLYDERSKSHLQTSLTDIK